MVTVTVTVMVREEDGTAWDEMGRVCRESVGPRKIYGVVRPFVMRGGLRR